MAAKLAILTHKIAIQLLLVAESHIICSSRSKRPSGNFWIHPRVCVHTHTYICVYIYMYVKRVTKEISNAFEFLNLQI
jgi:hypothetical protein